MYQIFVFDSSRTRWSNPFGGKTLSTSPLVWIHTKAPHTSLATSKSESSLPQLIKYAICFDSRERPSEELDMCRMHGGHRERMHPSWSRKYNVLQAKSALLLRLLVFWHSQRPSQDNVSISPNLIAILIRDAVFFLPPVTFNYAISSAAIRSCVMLES